MYDGKLDCHDEIKNRWVDNLLYNNCTCTIWIDIHCWIILYFQLHEGGVEIKCTSKITNKQCTIILYSMHVLLTIKKILDHAENRWGTHWWPNLYSVIWYHTMFFTVSRSLPLNTIKFDQTYAKKYLMILIHNKFANLWLCWYRYNITELLHA